MARLYRIYDVDIRTTIYSINCLNPITSEIIGILKLLRLSKQTLPVVVIGRSGDAIGVRSMSLSIIKLFLKRLWLNGKRLKWLPGRLRSALIGESCLTLSCQDTDGRVGGR